MMVIIETTFINDECSDNDYDDASGDRWVIETDGLLVKNVTRLVCLTPLGSPKTDKPKENLQKLRFLPQFIPFSYILHMPSSLLFLPKLKLNNSNLLKFSDLTTITNSASLPLFFAEKANNQCIYICICILSVPSMFFGGKSNNQCLNIVHTSTAV